MHKRKFLSYHFFSTWNYSAKRDTSHFSLTFFLDHFKTLILMCFSRTRQETLPRRCSCPSEKAENVLEAAITGASGGTSTASVSSAPPHFQKPCCFLFGKNVDIEWGKWSSFWNSSKVRDKISSLVNLPRILALPGAGGGGWKPMHISWWGYRYAEHADRNQAQGHRRHSVLSAWGSAVPLLNRKRLTHLLR